MDIRTICDTSEESARRRAGRPRRAVVIGSVGLAAVLGWASPSSAQLAAVPVSQLYLTGGQGFYPTDAFCLGPEAFLSTFRLGFVASRFGASVSYLRADWPWWDPPTALAEQVGLRHGDAVQAVAEAYPLRLLDAVEGQLAEALRPFVGLGVSIAGDGEASPTGGPGGVPIYAVTGGVYPLATIGASLTLRPAELPIGLQVQYRFTGMRGSDIEFVSPTGEIQVREGSQTLTWSELTVGLALAIGS